MKSAVVVLVLLVARGFADLAPDDQINKGLIQSVLKKIVNYKNLFKLMQDTKV